MDSVEPNTKVITNDHRVGTVIGVGYHYYVPEAFIQFEDYVGTYKLDDLQPYTEPDQEAINRAKEICKLYDPTYDSRNKAVSDKLIADCIEWDKAFRKYYLKE